MAARDGPAIGNGDTQESVAMDELRVSAQSAHAALQRGEPVLFLDVRSPEAWERADRQVPGSVRLPLSDFDTVAASLPHDRELVAYCT
ncbi:MAG TPA: rhodanese-like domain-containing protein [Dehalococcoidia bacterium]